VLSAYKLLINNSAWFIVMRLLGFHPDIILFICYNAHFKGQFGKVDG